MLQISKNIASRKDTLSISFFNCQRAVFLLILNRLSKIQLTVKFKINLKLLLFCIFVKDKGKLHVEILYMYTLIPIACRPRYHLEGP